MSHADLEALCAKAAARAELALLNEVAAQVRCGLGTLQGRERTPDIATRRAVAAWILSEYHHWTVARIARALSRTERQIARMLAAQPKATNKQGRRKMALVSGFTLTQVSPRACQA